MKRLSAIALALMLAGCSSVLTATRDTPIQDNHGTRTIGSSIDDQLIETKVAVNVNKANTAIETEGRIVVTSYNGVVLLAGQVPRGDLIATAGEAAGRNGSKRPLAKRRPRGGAASTSLISMSPLGNHGGAIDWGRWHT